MQFLVGQSMYVLLPKMTALSCFITKSATVHASHVFTPTMYSRFSDRHTAVPTKTSAYFAGKWTHICTGISIYSKW